MSTTGQIVTPGQPATPAVLFAPTGADDSARLAALVSGGLRTFQLVAGQTYQWKSRLLVPGQTPVTILGAPGANLVMNVGAGLGAAIGADAFNPRTLATTLSAPVTQGSRTFALTSGALVPNGAQILVTAMNGATPIAPVRAYTVISGGGTTTITVDRPILPNFQAGAQVSLAGNGGFPLGIQLIGNGTTVSGTADFFVELIGGALGCLVQGWNITGTTRSWTVGLDYASRASAIRDMVGTGTAGSWFLSMEQAESCEITGSTFTGTANQAIYLNGSDRCRVERVTANVAAGIGLLATPETAGDTYSARANVVEACNFSGCNVGILVADAVDGLDLIGNTADGCATYALQLSPQLGTNPPNRIRVIGGSYQGAPVLVDGGTGHRFSNVNLSGGAIGLNITGLYPTADLEVDECQTDGVTGTLVSIGISSGANITGTKLRAVRGNSPSAACAVNVYAGVPDLLLEDCTFTDVATTGGGGNAVVQFGAGANRYTIRGCEFNLSSAAGVNAYAMVFGANNVADVSDTTFSFAHTNAGQLISILAQGAGTWVRARYCRGVANGGAGAGTRYGFYFAAANFLDVGPGCDFSAFETPTTFSGGATTNRGTVTLNGATPVDVAWAKAGANTDVRLTRKATGGTPGAQPTYTITAGTKVSVTGTTGDTSVYAYVFDGA